jgi:hypothetical protein
MSKIDPEEERRRRAAKALSAIDPQTAIEMILSREWGNRDKAGRWVTKRAELVRRLAERHRGLDWRRYTEADDRFFRDALAEARGERRDPVWLSVAQEMVASLRDMNLRLAAVEDSWIPLERLGPSRRGGSEEPGGEPAPAEGGITPRVLARMRELTGTLVAFDTLRVRGEPFHPEAYRHNLTRLRDLGEYLSDHLERLGPEAGPAAEAEHGGRSVLVETTVAVEAEATSAEALQQLLGMLHEGVELARERVQMQREALLNQLAKAAQKPDFVVRRDWLGDEYGHLLPASESWDEAWYEGPRATRGEEPEWHGEGEEEPSAS